MKDNPRSTIKIRIRKCQSALQRLEHSYKKGKVDASTYESWKRGYLNQIAAFEKQLEG